MRRKSCCVDGESHSRDLANLRFLSGKSDVGTEDDCNWEVQFDGSIQDHVVMASRARALELGRFDGEGQLTILFVLAKGVDELLLASNLCRLTKYIVHELFSSVVSK